MTQPITVFILSWERPLYLWACLDSLYRYTQFPCRFILIDNGSRDPLVNKVIVGFERRDMFHAVHHQDKNLPSTMHTFLHQYWHSLGDVFAYVEGDVVIEYSDPCWLTEMARLMKADENMAMLGAYIDKSDFIPERRARKIEPFMNEACLNELIKARSPERNIPESDKKIISPFNPPGRLLLLRKKAIQEVGLHSDGKMHRALIGRGYQTGIATRVRHRHLSLLNLFDYPDYAGADRQRYLFEFDRAGKHGLNISGDLPLNQEDQD